MINQVIYGTYQGAKNNTKCGLLAISLSKEVDVRLTTCVSFSNAHPFWVISTKTNNPQATILKLIFEFKRFGKRSFELVIFKITVLFI